MAAIDVLAWLKERHPNRFTDIHLRTMQRMVKAWRALQATRIIHCGTTTLTLMPGERVVAPAPPPTVALGNILI